MVPASFAWKVAAVKEGQSRISNYCLFAGSVCDHWVIAVLAVHICCYCTRLVEGAEVMVDHSHVAAGWLGNKKLHYS
jgi:hypothetical protein